MTDTHGPAEERSTAGTQQAFTDETRIGELVKRAAGEADR